MKWQRFIQCLIGSIQNGNIFVFIDCSEPVGKFFVQVCTTTPCQLCKANDILATVRKVLNLAENESCTSDGLFTVVEVECAGACVNAPVVAINDNYYVSKYANIHS